MFCTLRGLFNAFRQMVPVDLKQTHTHTELVAGCLETLPRFSVPMEQAQATHGLYSFCFGV